MSVRKAKLVLRDRIAIWRIRKLENIEVIFPLLVFHGIALRYPQNKWALG